MTTATVSLRHPVSLSSFKFFGAVCETVKQAFTRSAVAKADTASADGDVWQLYRMTRGADSVPPAVVDKLSEVAASK